MNYDGLKGMEATAALQMVKDVFQNEEVEAFVQPVWCWTTNGANRAFTQP
jgi:hypothetical protein